MKASGDTVRGDREWNFSRESTVTRNSKNEAILAGFLTFGLGWLAVPFCEDKDRTYTYVRNHRHALKKEFRFRDRVLASSRVEVDNRTTVECKETRSSMTYQYSMRQSLAIEPRRP